MGIRLLRHFAQFFDHMRRWRQIRIAHAEVNDILTRAARRRTHRIDLSDDIRWQAFDAVEFFGHKLPFRVD